MPGHGQQEQKPSPPIRCGRNLLKEGPVHEIEPVSLRYCVPSAWILSHHSYPTIRTSLSIWIEVGLNGLQFLFGLGLQALESVLFIKPSVFIPGKLIMGQEIDLLNMLKPGNKFGNIRYKGDTEDDLFTGFIEFFQVFQDRLITHIRIFLMDPFVQQLDIVEKEVRKGKDVLKQ